MHGLTLSLGSLCSAVPSNRHDELGYRPVYMSRFQNTCIPHKDRAAAVEGQLE